MGKTTDLQYTLAMHASQEEKVLRALVKGSCRAKSEGMVARCGDTVPGGTASGVL